MQSISARCCALVVGVAMLGSIGCASTPQLATWWPWYEPDQTAELAQYGPISRQKIESLKELQKAHTPPTIEDSRLADQMQHETDPLVRLHIVRTLAQYRTE